ncbi:2-hydroxy-6-oxo-2,4-heptadienoate hydrolase [Candidatus Pelagibacter sp.]|jgi:tetratricopeptide (TPR) repeat protein|nr:2-hydroxy-6-oxo-2,4-heptadienoate hydrolase [Candidatus Pelagibacter sp.]|tara:strand:+ start:113 stop:664 length:552 start_codon:yes stop_codon:yes gene_type:complete
MKICKIFILFLFVSSFFHSAQSSQKIILDKLFDQLIKTNDSNNAEQLEKKIWSVWSKHPNDNKLTEKMEFGTELMQYGDYNYALRVFDNIIVTDPQWSEAWNKRATVYFLMNEFTNSLDDIDKVLSIEPRHFGALSGQARIFIKLQKYEKAIKSIERALEFYPSFRSRKLIPEIEKLIKEESI